MYRQSNFALCFIIGDVYDHFTFALILSSTLIKRNSKRKNKCKRGKQTNFIKVQHVLLKEHMSSTASTCATNWFTMAGTTGISATVTSDVEMATDNASSPHISTPGLQESWTCDQSLSAAELLKRIQSGSSDFQAMMYAPFPFMAIIIILYIDLFIFIIRNSISYQRTRLLLWVITVFPVVGISCVVGLYMPRTASVVAFGRSFFVASSMLKFFYLIIDYYGGIEEMELALKEELIVPHNFFPFCLFLCCKKQSLTAERIRKIEWTIYQIIIVYPLSYFFQTFLVAEGLLSVSIAAYLISLLIGGLATLSGLTCLYGFVIIGKASHYALQQFFTRGKYISLVLLVACNTLQGILIALANLISPLPCGFPYPDREQVFLYQSYILIYEVFVFSIIAWYAFRRNEHGMQVVIKSSPTTEYYANVLGSDHDLPVPEYKSKSGSSYSLEHIENGKAVPQRTNV